MKGGYSESAYPKPMMPPEQPPATAACSVGRCNADCPAARLPGCPPDQPQVACRDTFRSRLCDTVDTLRRRANELEALGRAIPNEITTQADEALWQLLVAYGRR